MECTLNQHHSPTRLPFHDGKFHTKCSKSESQSGVRPDAARDAQTPTAHAWRSVPLATQMLTGCTLASLQSRPANGSPDLR